MSSHRLAKKDSLVIITVISTLVITSSSISNYGYVDIGRIVYGQSDPDQANSNITRMVNMQDIPIEKVHGNEPNSPSLKTDVSDYVS